MNRRTVLLAGSSLILLAAAGAGVALAQPELVFGRVLRRHLPGVRLPDASIAAFAREYWPVFQRRYGPRRVWGQLLTHVADDVLPGELARTARAERDILTDFLTGSNFFRLSDPRTETVEFTGLADACGNQFRRA